MANAYAQYAAFQFNNKIHVVAHEQAGYFEVVFKALELIDPKKFSGLQRHLAMGMVNLTERKMSSRTGEILTVDWLIDEVKKRVHALAKERKFESEETVEAVTIGAIKYSVLKVATGTDVAFNIEKSVSLAGDSGPYIQYTYARTCSVIEKAKKQTAVQQKKLEPAERALILALNQFENVATAAADSLSPNIVAAYIFELAQHFNLFYQKHQIIGTEFEGMRIALTKAVGTVLREGLDLLGIKAPERM